MKLTSAFSWQVLTYTLFAIFELSLDSSYFLGSFTLEMFLQMF